MHVYLLLHLFLKYHCWEISIFFFPLWLPQVLVASCRLFPCGLSSWVHRLSCSVSCGILVSWPRIKPTSPARWILNHWTTREVPDINIFQFSWTLLHDMSLQVNVTKQDIFCAQEGENTYAYYRNTHTYFRRRVVSFQSRYYVSV